MPVGSNGKGRAVELAGIDATATGDSRSFDAVGSANDVMAIYWKKATTWRAASPAAVAPPGRGTHFP
jgi:hypothetical protein